MSYVLLFLYVLVGIFWTILSQFITKRTTNSLIKRISLLATGLEQKATSPKEKEIIEQEAAVFKLVSIERERGSLSFLTITIGLVEFFSFFLISFFIFLNFKDFEILRSLGQFLGGWLAIKTIGNYNQWSSPIFGRACFYVFFLGTVMNIGFAIVLAFGGYLLLFNM